MDAVVAAGGWLSAPSSRCLLETSSFTIPVSSLDVMVGCVSCLSKVGLAAAARRASSVSLGCGSTFSAMISASTYFAIIGELYGWAFSAAWDVFCD